MKLQNLRKKSQNITSAMQVAKVGPDSREPRNKMRDGPLDHRVAYAHKAGGEWR